MRASFDQRVEAVERRLRHAWARYERSNKGVIAAVVHAASLWLIERRLERKFPGRFTNVKRGT